MNNCTASSTTGGVGVADYNSDGWVDILATRQFEYDILYRNNKDGTFTDVSGESGLEITRNHRSNGVLFCDIDNDK